MQRLYQRAGFHPARLLWPASFELLAAAAEGTSIALMIPAIDAILNHHQPNSLLAVFGCIIGLITVSYFLNYLASISVSHETRHLGNSLRQLVFKRYLTFGKLFFDSNNPGYIYEILIGHIQRISKQVHELHHCFHSLVMFIAYFALMIIISYKLTLCMLLIFPVIYFTFQRLIRNIKRGSHALEGARKDMSKKIMNVLSCIPLVKAYTNEPKEEAWLADGSSRLERAEFRIDLLENLISPAQGILTIGIIFIVVTLFSALHVFETSAAIAHFAVFLLLTKRCFTQFGTINLFRGALAVVSGPLSEVLWILNDEQKHPVRSGHLTFGGLRRAIEIRNLSFRYPSGVTALKRVNAVFHKGKMTAIVGSSGSGKTTLINLLMRFYDSAPGTILIDGVDIREYSSTSLRQKIAVVTQETMLFDASFKTNLTYGLDRAVPAEELEAVCARARLLDLINTYPTKFNTEIGHRGVRLSGGQKQRLSIARAMLKKAEILILDEATSSLDAKNEKLIQSAIRELISGCTAIVVAHRLSTIEHADYVLVIEKGRVVEEGCIDELLASRGEFYDNWVRQKLLTPDTQGQPFSKNGYRDLERTMQAL